MINGDKDERIPSFDCPNYRNYESQTRILREQLQGIGLSIAGIQDQVRVLAERLSLHIEKKVHHINYERLTAELDSLINKHIGLKEEVADIKSESKLHHEKLLLVFEQLADKIENLADKFDARENYTRQRDRDRRTGILYPIIIFTLTSVISGGVSIGLYVLFGGG